MSRNGSGTYSLPVNSWNPALNGVPATAADWQALINDVASALTQSVSRDGQTIMTGNLAMGGNKLTGLSAGTAAGDSLRWEQLFSQGQPQDLASAATVDIGAQLTTVLNITGTTTITSFGTNYNGPRFLRFAGILTLTHGAALVLPGSANITTAAGDSAIVVPLGTPAAGWRVVAYQRASDAPGAVADNSVSTAKIQNDAVTFAKIQNVNTGIVLGRTTAGSGDVEELAISSLTPDASETVKGIVELATTAEAQAGTDAVRAITPATLKSAQIQLGTAVNSTSGTAIDFTGIPSWVKRVTLMLNGVSTSGTSRFLVQVGSGSIQSSGYVGVTGSFTTGIGTEAYSGNAFALVNGNEAASAMRGQCVFTSISGNDWIMSAICSQTGANRMGFSSGSVSLSGALDRVRITTVGGTDTFDAGAINISWE